MKHTTMYLIVAFLLTIMVAAAALAQPTYRCVNERGQTTYTDLRCNGSPQRPTPQRLSNTDAQLLTPGEWVAAGRLASSMAGPYVGIIGQGYAGGWTTSYASPQSMYPQGLVGMLGPVRGGDSDLQVLRTLGRPDAQVTHGGCGQMYWAPTGGNAGRTVTTCGGTVQSITLGR
jgi:hypothetical protein